MEGISCARFLREPVALTHMARNKAGMIEYPPGQGKGQNCGKQVVNKAWLHIRQSGVSHASRLSYTVQAESSSVLRETSDLPLIS